MDALVTLSGWDVLVVLILGSLCGISISQIVAQLTVLRRRTMTRLQRQRWRELGVFGLRNGRISE